MNKFNFKNWFEKEVKRLKKDPEFMKMNEKLDSQISIKEIRKALDLTQSEMAERLGYSTHSRISDIERGKENMSNQVRAHLRTIQKHELKNM